ncbi:RING finger domain-containing protein [Endozoicomonas sp. ALD040]|uniref:RING finger domain-containing protein n=1 Tax=Endozoicomonas sp. ALD040 TaxID=3403079 RepID=UPI003BB163B7
MNGITPPNTPPNTLPADPNSPSSPYQEATGDCPICFEAFDGREVRVLEECRHMFHEDCLSKWLSENTTCPYCRHSLGDREAQPLLDRPPELGLIQSATFSPDCREVIYERAIDHWARLHR